MDWLQNRNGLTVVTGVGWSADGAADLVAKVATGRERSLECALLPGSPRLCGSRCSWAERLPLPNSV